MVSRVSNRQSLRKTLFCGNPSPVLGISFLSSLASSSTGSLHPTNICSAPIGAMVKVAVKWNKRVFEDVEVVPKVADFKAKLQELTVSGKPGNIHNNECFIVTTALERPLARLHSLVESKVYSSVTPACRRKCKQLSGQFARHCALVGHRWYMLLI